MSDDKDAKAAAAGYLHDEGKAALLAWAESGGFAALHSGGASNEAIVEDLLDYLAREGLAIAPLGWLITGSGA